MNDLTATRALIERGQTSARAELESALQRATSPANRHTFVRHDADSALAALDRPDLARLPLAGAAVSVKDLFDVAGQVTAAGSAVLADAPAATADCPAVARLRAAGAALVGRTNMTEFAFSGVGINPHHGTPVNPADPGVERIPGGSSSGAAVSVATGAAQIGLGSDTGGSIRIPAALCGIVGFKSTARLVPTDGALPLSTTLDTVCALTRSVRDAVLAHEVLAARSVALPGKPLAQLRLAVVQTTLLDGMDLGVAQAFEAALRILRDAGARIEDIPLDAIRDLSGLQASGGFTAAESFAWHRELLATRGDRYDPRVRSRIERGAGMKAWEYLDLFRARAGWIARIEAALHGYDAVLSPTVPLLAPPIAELAPGAERDEAFFRTNALLLRNTSVVNMLDGCGLSLPCQAPGRLPVGLMLWHAALRDDAILDAGLAVEAALTAAHA